jgi:transcriptional/translational regulatory protein YebC/TACO1
MFRKLGVLSYDAGANEDAITEAAIEAGADDVAVYDDGAIDVLTAADAFADVKAAMEAAGLAPGFAEVTMRADNDIAVAGEAAQQVRKLLAWLEDMDDVQNVYSNADPGDGAGA